MKLKKTDPCPKCGGKLSAEEFMGDDWLICKKCGFDESDEGFLHAGGKRNTQSEKTKYTPYRSGGGKGRR